MEMSVYSGQQQYFIDCFQLHEIFVELTGPCESVLQFNCVYIFIWIEILFEIYLKLYQIELCTYSSFNVSFKFLCR